MFSCRQPISRVVVGSGSMRPFPGQRLQTFCSSAPPLWGNMPVLKLCLSSLSLASDMAHTPNPPLPVCLLFIGPQFRAVVLSWVLEYISAELQCSVGVKSSSLESGHKVAV